jgi:hypothetical protein
MLLCTLPSVFPYILFYAHHCAVGTNTLSLVNWHPNYLVLISLLFAPPLLQIRYNLPSVPLIAAHYPGI